MRSVDWRSLAKERGTSPLFVRVITAVITLTCNYSVITPPIFCCCVITRLCAMPSTNSFIVITFFSPSSMVIRHRGTCRSVEETIGRNNRAIRSHHGRRWFHTTFKPEMHSPRCSFSGVHSPSSCRQLRRKVGRGLAKYRRGVAEAVLCKYRGLLFAKSPEKITPKAQVALATTKTSQLRSSRTSHRSTRTGNEVAGRLRIQIRNYVIFWHTWHSQQLYCRSQSLALIPLVSHTITPTCSLRTRRSFQPPCHHALAEKLWEASKRLPASSAHSLNYIRHALAVQLHPT